MNEILIILNNIGYSDLKDFGDSWRTKPIYRPSDNPTSLCIKKSTGEWYDFSERVGGKLPQLIQKTLNLSSLDSVKQHLGGLSIPTNSSNQEIGLIDVKKFDKILINKLIKDHSYWQARGISPFTLEQFKGGIADNGRMKGRYVFPIFDEKGDIIGFTGRAINKNNIRWKHLGNKSNWLFPNFGFKEIQNKKSAILVESPGDALSLIEVGVKNVIVLFGVSISPKIICYLLKSDINNVKIILNNDYDNNFVGNKAAGEIKKELLSHFDDSQIEIVTPPENDLNDMLIKDRESFKNFCLENKLLN
jgi:5S rRNA maturation endonuclease (ribonuclease M5)